MRCLGCKKRLWWWQLQCRVQVVTESKGLSLWAHTEPGCVKRTQQRLMVELTGVSDV